MNGSELTLELFYSQKRTYFEQQWNSLIDNTTEIPFVWFVFILNSSMIVIYWSLGSVYLLMDLTKRPKWIQKYKIREINDIELNQDAFIKITKTVLFNQVIVQTLFAASLYPLVGIIEVPSVALRTIPSFTKGLLQLIGCWILREISFYYQHRLLHHGKFYIFFHKKHHSFTANTAITAEYCTPIEHILVNMVPAVVGPFILQLNFIPVFLWFAHIMLSTLQEHSGYDFPWYYNSKRHNTHHQSFNTNYGLIGLMDWIHGTSKRSIE